MKSNQMVAAWGLGLCVGLMALSGCSNKPDTAALEKAFKTGSPAAKQVVSNIVVKMNAGTTLTVGEDVRTLWRLPRLTQEQREAAMAFVEQLSEYNDKMIAATNGGKVGVFGAGKPSTNAPAKRPSTNRPPVSATATATASAVPATNAPAATAATASTAPAPNPPATTTPSAAK